MRSSRASVLLRDWRLWVLFFIVLAGVVAAIAQGAIAQDQGYHQFADQRRIFGIPNFWNVISNLPFVWAGVVGLRSLWLSTEVAVFPALRVSYAAFFIGTLLVGFGSAYYHWQPNDASLIWDRLPMTVAFMALFSIIIGEHISLRLGRCLLLPLLGIGVISILWWWRWADLRLYALVQFLPVILSPLIVVLFPRPTSQSALWALFGAYAVAKVLEYFDADIQRWIGFSGHPLKHLVAAIGMCVFAIAIRRREIK